MQCQVIVTVKAMKLLTISLLFSLLVFISFCEDITSAAASNSNNVYIVYMGAAQEGQAQILIDTLLKGKVNALVHRYRHGFSGFAARLSAEEATSIANKPEVVSVFRDPILQLHTTRSWDFLKYQTDIKIDSNPSAIPPSDGSDTIIGIMDTGVWPESESFNDKDMGQVPTSWKGTCMVGKNFSSSNCNRKIIGARFYKGDEEEDGGSDSPRDTIGHGTHVSSTAAGSLVENASYYGLATGTAKGGSPASRIAIYKVCDQHGCAGSSILAAFDDAVADGVHILSLSLGAPSWADIRLHEDPIAIGAFHAVEKGITVVCSAGNDGPSAGTVVNAAPWIMTVAASTIDRDFRSDLLLGGNKVVEGGGINFANIGGSPVYPLIYAKSAKKTEASDDDARNCNSNTLEEEMVKGKIVVCDNDDGGIAEIKQDAVKSLGGIGIAVIDDKERSVASKYRFPTTVISTNDATDIFSYLNSTENPVATIFPTVTVSDYKPAPAIAYFSARGPSAITPSILKPDITAPGVTILAAWKGDDTMAAPEGKEPPLFNVISGTSMAAPHVSGVAAMVRSRNPTFGPSAIRSAIMTTAIQLNNLKTPITAEKGAAATPYDVGAGELSTTKSLEPGLVYETSTVDYLNFLCYYGYNVTTIKIIAKDTPDDFGCPKNSSKDLVSNINYPSIAISGLSGKESKKVNRSVTNVGGDGETEYSVSVEEAAGIKVQVVPEKLQFNKNGEKKTYQVIFWVNGGSQLEEDVHGAITWSNGKYRVRSPFVVSVSQP